MSSVDSCSRKLRNQGCAVQRGGMTVWFGVTEGKEIIAMLLCFQSGLPNSLKGYPERLCPQFYYQVSLPGCWVFELNECFPLILPLPPARSY